METIAKRRLLFAERPDSFTAVRYQPLAFSQVLENQETLKKQTSPTGLEKARDGTIQNALTYLLLCHGLQSGRPNGERTRKMQSPRIILRIRKNCVCSLCSQVQRLPLTHKIRNATSVFGKRNKGKPTSLAELFQGPPTFCWQENPPISCA